MLDVPGSSVPISLVEEAFNRLSDYRAERSAAGLIDVLKEHFLEVYEPAYVKWTHPSWRDLIIDELTKSPQKRHKFIEKCGIYGFPLAISQAGGASGERAFPLLIDKEDWDSLKSTASRIASDCSDSDMIRLFSSLESISEPADLYNGERIGIIKDVLDVCVKRWDDSQRPINIDILKGYFDLAVLIKPPLPAPNLEPTWLSFVNISSNSLIKGKNFQDWIQLIEVIRDNAGIFLRQVRFPMNYRELIDSFPRYEVQSVIMRDLPDDPDEDPSDELDKALITKEIMDKCFEIYPKLKSNLKDEGWNLEMELEMRISALEDLNNNFKKHHEEYEADYDPMEYDETHGPSIGDIFNDL
jgi:hypothetical protein